MNSAYNEVKDKRCIIGPNIVFLSQLYDFEKNLLELKSSDNSTANKCNVAANTHIQGIQVPVV